MLPSRIKRSLATRYHSYYRRVNLSKLLAMRNKEYLSVCIVDLSLQLSKHLDHQALRFHSSARIHWRFSNLCAEYSSSGVQIRL